ncbi:MAG: class I SAM-dependent methyltransferase [Casimicrobiaceae bacterium]
MTVREPAPHSIADFDARAATWDDDPKKLERARAVAGAIAASLPARTDMRALEYGCGTGLLSFLLREHFARMTLADVSDGMLAVARAKVAANGDGDMEVEKLDLLADPDSGERYDVITSLMTLHHIDDTDAILRRFHEVLRPGGYLCIADLDREDGSFHGEGFAGHKGFDRDELVDRTRRAGFASAAAHTAHEMTKPVNGVPRTFPIFLLVAQKA